MKAATFKALLMDLDGVIRLWPGQEEEMDLTFGLPAGALREAAFETTLLRKVITGQIPDNAWRHEVFRQLRRSYPGSRARAAVEAWSAGAGIINQPVLETLRKARAAVKIVLVTNATSRLNADLNALGLMAEFDSVVNSSVVGAVKPEEQIYRAALASVKSAAREALFVDDSQPNVGAAERFGLCAHFYESVHGFNQFLKSKGVLADAT